MRTYVVVLLQSLILIYLKQAVKENFFYGSVFFYGNVYNLFYGNLWDSMNPFHILSIGFRYDIMGPMFGFHINFCNVLAHDSQA